MDLGADLERGGVASWRPGSSRRKVIASGSQRSWGSEGGSMLRKATAALGSRFSRMVAARWAAL